MDKYLMNLAKGHIHMIFSIIHVIKYFLKCSEINMHNRNCEKVRSAVVFQTTQNGWNVHPIILQRSLDRITNTLVAIYRASFKLCYLSDDWNRVRVIFLPKPGKSDNCNAESFRPICLSAFLLKSMERLVDTHKSELLVYLFKVLGKHIRKGSPWNQYSIKSWD